jgi:electron transport complex protein RnfB
MNRSAISADAIDGMLPQTQCGQCGYSGCRPYADAIARGEAPFNQCPPGGAEVMAEIAALLGEKAMSLNTAFGHTMQPAVARIEEAACIGCTLCLDACPVDAIVGARKLIHTVIAVECTGCALCLPPCPVDCIVMEPTGAPRNRDRQRSNAPRLRERFQDRQQRFAEREQQRRDRAARSAEARKKNVIEKVLSRARERLASRQT